MTGRTLAANRDSAQKSKGPFTPAGKHHHSAPCGHSPHHSGADGSSATRSAEGIPDGTGRLTLPVAAQSTPPASIGRNPTQSTLGFRSFFQVCPSIVVQIRPLPRRRTPSIGSRCFESLDYA
jgi:hypothetical protein